MTNTALDGDQRAGRDFPLVISGREGEAATDRLDGDRAGGDMLVQLGASAHRDQDHPQSWRLDQRFRSPATGHVGRESLDLRVQVELGNGLLVLPSFSPASTQRLPIARSVGANSTCRWWRPASLHSGHRPGSLTKMVVKFRNDAVHATAGAVHLEPGVQRSLVRLAGHEKRVEDHVRHAVVVAKNDRVAGGQLDDVGHRISPSAKSLVRGGPGGMTRVSTICRRPWKHRSAGRDRCRSMDGARRRLTRRGDAQTHANADQAQGSQQDVSDRPGHAPAQPPPGDPVAGAGSSRDGRTIHF